MWSGHGCRDRQGVVLWWQWWMMVSQSWVWGEELRVRRYIAETRFPIFSGVEYTHTDLNRNYVRSYVS